MMNVLHIITGIGYGGAEKVVYDLCKKSMDEDNVQFFVVSLDDSTDRFEDFMSIGIQVERFEMRKDLFGLRDALKRLNRFIIDNHIHIVHAHMFHAALLGSINNAFNKRIPLIFTAHSKNIEGKSREISLYGLRSLRNHDVLFSESHHQFYNKPKSYSIIGNGIDIGFIKDKAIGPKFEEFTFVHVARFNEAKNHKFLINTVSELIKKGLKFKVLLVGDGELRKDIEYQIKEEMLEDYVKLLGLRKDIPEILGKCHAFLLPSKWEGLPISVLEAGAAETPVIATPVGNLPEVLEDERGYCVPENEFGFAMQDVLDNYTEAQKRAKKLLDYIKSMYSLEHCYREHLKLYSRYV